MEIYFRTKEESNSAQLQEFLDLDGGGRFFRFLLLMSSSQLLPIKNRGRWFNEQFEITTIEPMQDWDDEIRKFLRLSSEYRLRMILVGGGAVNFHGYQRHSADVDFWIDTSRDNFDRLIQVFQMMDYNVDEFPKAVIEKRQNISVKFSPSTLSLELITRFSLNKTFEEAYSDSVVVEMEEGLKGVKWYVLSYEDLIGSKLKSQRPKDLLDIQELERIKGEL